MAKVVTDNQYYTAIANAIRALTGSSNAYTPAQMAPAIIGYIAGGIDLSDVESYFITDVINAINYVKELGTDDWVHYIVMADSHYSDNYSYLTSGAVVKAMMGSGYFDKFIHLGDITDKGNVSELNYAIEQVGDLNGQMLYCLGNHELSGNNEITSLIHSALTSELDADWNANFNSATYKNPYYVYKNTDKKIAFIHYTNWNVDTASAEVTWLYDTVEALPDDYTVFIISHSPYTTLGSTLQTGVSNQFILFPTRLRKGLYLGGHWHVDRHTEYNDGTLTQKLFENDAAFEKSSGEDDSPHTEGTDTEIAITLLSIGTGTNNAIKSYRIGAYNSALDLNANMPNFPDLTMKFAVDEPFVTCGGINTSGQIATGDTYRLKPAFFPVQPSTYYYIYNPSVSARDAKTLIRAEYSKERIDTFVTSSRLAGTPALVEARVLKIYTKSTSNFLLLSVNGTSFDPNDFVVTTEVPDLNITIDDVQWTTGTVTNLGIPDTTSGWLRTDMPIRVKPSTTYTLACSDTSITSFRVGEEKGTNAMTAVNSTRDNITRVSVNNGANFTTPSNCNYIYISYSGSEATTGTWTLTEVTS